MKNLPGCVTSQITTQSLVMFVKPMQVFITCYLKQTNLIILNIKKERSIMQKATIQLETLSCPSCLQKIDNAVKGIKGVEEDSVKVMFNASKVKVNFDSEAVAIENIEKPIEDLGYPVIKSKVKPV